MYSFGDEVSTFGVFRRKRKRACSSRSPLCGSCVSVTGSLSLSSEARRDKLLVSNCSDSNNSEMQVVLDITNSDPS